MKKFSYLLALCLPVLVFSSCGEVTEINEINGHELVDLGLSVMWATCNVGANSPEQYGDYYAWGETETKSCTYDVDTYKLCDGSYNTMNKYCTDSRYGTVDNKKILELSDDVANVKWGGSWRMPSVAEIDELINNCSWIKTLDYEGTGVPGYIVRSTKNDNSIFLPAAGLRECVSLEYDGSYGQYWSSELDPGSCSNNAYFLSFDLEDWGMGNSSRFHGLSVRPVISQNDDSGGRAYADSIAPVEYDEMDDEITNDDNLDDVNNFVVDLGLSVKWGTCNVGANYPEEYGDYYAWGETETKSCYNWETYKWCNGSYNSITKYCIKNSDGIVDNKTTLELSDDVANVRWAMGNGRMPTKAEFEELYSNCTWTWTTDYEGTGVHGYIVESNMPGCIGNSIFLPAAGSKSDETLSDAGKNGFYWSSSLGSPYSISAECMYFSSSSSYLYSNFRYSGQSVRLVCP